MNKQDVATELDCSTRQVEKYASEDRLGTIEYVRGKRGREAKYADAAVAGLKAELERERREVVGHAPHALQRAGNPQTLEALGQAIADALRSAQTTQGNGAGGAVSVADLAHKLMLSIDEAAALAGLSANHVREAIRAGKLKAKIVGRGWRVKRPDLDAYVKKL
jgi:excisionase family DNA binding protein